MQNINFTYNYYYYYYYDSSFTRYNKLYSHNERINTTKLMVCVYNKKETLTKLL